MSTNTKRVVAPSVLYIIVLLGLVYMFHTELFVTGIRLYVAAVHNSKAEQLLGDYYQNNALLSDDLAKSFYASSMKKYKEELSTVSPEQQALIKLRLGQLYLCGKGVEPNTTEAKRWFDEALTLANSNAKSHEELISEIKQGLSFANAGDHNKMEPGRGNMIQPCHLQSEMEFFKTLKP
jgi:TPR repeat protein